MFYSSFRSFYLDLFSLLKSPKNGVHILNGHYISVLNEDASVFSDLLYQLSKFCTFITIQEAVFLLTENQVKNFNRCYVAFTFDDGFIECYTKIAPVLDDYKTNAAFFVIPNFIDGDSLYKFKMCNETLQMEYPKEPMSWSNLIELNNSNFIIGSHTLNHERLSILNNEEVEFELLESKAILENRLSFKCDYFAYPYGKLTDISESSINLASNIYRYCFTQSNHKKYFSFDDRFINRRHFEGIWPARHVKYFLSVYKS